MRSIEIIQDVRCPIGLSETPDGTNGLYEIPLKVGSNIYQVFCFFDEGQLVVLANGFQKKARKTPPSEIERALKIKKEYENEKE